MTQPKPGQRLRCTDCGTEIVIIKADGVRPSCCGKQMTDPSVNNIAIRA